MSAAALLALGSQPIRPDAPAGDSARESPEFETLQAELRKLEHPDQPTPNWDVAVKAAATLLGQRSKDLLVGSYLCVGLLERDGYPGLAAGLTVMRDMVANFWETLYPEMKRMRGRVAAFEWLGERGAQRIGRKSSAGQAEAVKTCAERVRELEELLSSRLESGGGMLNDLRRALEAAAESERAPEPIPAGFAAAPAASSGPSGPASVLTAEDLEKALTEAKRLLRISGDFLRGSEARNPMAYRLPRFAAWMTVKQLPPSADGKTQIPAPQPADLLERLQQMVGSAQWAGVLQETEGRIGASVFWLDLHRLAHAALEGQGEEFQPAADAVREEVAALLRRFPALPELRFANDQPIANPETRTWIQQKVLAAPAGAAAPAPAPPAAAPVESDEELEAARAQARGLAKQRKLGEALALLERGAQRAGSFRERVAWRLELARVCMESGQHETALARLEALDDELRGSTVEDWSPALCVEVIKQLLLCRQKVLSSSSRGTPEDAQRSRDLMGRLCRLDVVAAVELNGRR